jgi:osmoprotectant transport system permease protein
VPTERTATAVAGIAEGRTAVPDETAAARAFRIIRYFGVPIGLAGVLLALLLYVNGRQLDSIERRTLNMDVILDRVWQHIQLTVVSSFFVVLIGIVVGILLTRPFARRITPVVLAIVNIGQAVPSIGLIVLFALYWDIGFTPAVTALIVYSVLPVLRNTMVGLQGVDRALLEAGQGMGMSRMQVLRRIEMPLAVPVILAGVRTAVIINVGTATLATFTGAGGLGDLINNGLRLGRDTVILVGGVLTAVLALLLDWVAGIAEDVLRPRGL